MGYNPFRGEDGRFTKADGTNKSSGLDKALADLDIANANGDDIKVVEVENYIKEKHYESEIGQKLLERDNPGTLTKSDVVNSGESRELRYGDRLPSECGKVELSDMVAGHVRNLLTTFMRDNEEILDLMTKEIMRKNKQHDLFSPKEPFLLKESEAKKIAKVARDTLFSTLMEDNVDESDYFYRARQKASEKAIESESFFED